LTGTTTVDVTGRAVVAVTLAADALTEGAETMTLSAAGKTASVTVNDTSTTPAPVVPPVTPAASYVVTANAATINEGQSVTYTVTTKNVAAGTYSYLLGGDVKNGDIVGGVTGTVSIDSSGIGYITVTAVADNVTDGDENMTITIGGVTSATVVRVLDTSKTPVVSLNTAPALTTGTDTLGSATTTGVQSFTANIADSFSAFDAITGGLSGADTLTANVTATALPFGVTVTNIATATINATGVGYSANVTGWTGLGAINVFDTNAAADPVSVTANTTTNVTASTGGTLGGAITVVGGRGVTTSQTGTAGGTLAISGESGGAVLVTDAQYGNTISVLGTPTSVTINATNQNNNTGTITVGGATTQPTGAVVINGTTAFAANGTQGNITVIGGSSVAITENLNSFTAGDSTTTVTGGAVAVTGGATTTSVTVTEPTAVTARAAQSAQAGQILVNAVAAAPGVQPVTGIAAQAAQPARAAASGVVGGTVTIADSAFGPTGTGSIASVSLANTGAATINDNALTSLSLTGTVGNVTINNNNTASLVARSSTLGLNLNGLPPTAAAGITNNFTATTAATITDTNSEIATLNVVTSGADSTLAAFTDNNLLALNVSGANRLTLSSINSSLTSLSVTGAAGFSDGASARGQGLASRGAALSITNTSTGPFNAVLDATTQTYVGGPGVSTITISSTADATRAITAGAGTTDQLILDGGAYALTAATATRVTGFERLGLTSSVTGTIDMSVLNATANFVEIFGGTQTITRLARNASLQLDGTSTTVVGYVDTTGAADVVTVTMAPINANTTQTVTSLTLADSLGVGVGTVNLVANINAAGGEVATTGAHTITTLVDNGLSTLNVSGTAGLIITTINEATTPAASFTLNNTSTGLQGVTIGTLTDNSLTTLTFAGSGNSTITSLRDTQASLSIVNQTGLTQNIGTLTDNNLTSLTLGAGVALGQAGTALLTNGLQDSSTAGVTIAGAADNAHVTVNLSGGAAAGRTDAITLGNGNNVIVDASTAGTVNVTTGNGANYIQLGSATLNTSALYNVTTGVRASTSAVNTIVVGTAGNAFATAPNLIITGANAGDIIGFGNDTASANTALTAVSLTSATSVATAVAALENVLTSPHQVAFGVYGGNTYVVQTASGTVAASDTTVFQLVGSQTLTASTGYVTVGSTAGTFTPVALTGGAFNIAASAAQAVTLLGGSNTVNAYGASSATAATLTSAAATTSLTFNDLSSSAAQTNTVTMAGSVAGLSSLTVNNSSTSSGAAALTLGTFAAPALTSITLNNSGTTANTTAGTVTGAAALTTINLSGTSPNTTAQGNVVNFTGTVTSTGGLTVNDTVGSITGTTNTVNLTMTGGPNALTVNLTPPTVVAGGPAVGNHNLTFGDIADNNLATVTLNANATVATGTLTMGTIASTALATLNITNSGTAPVVVGNLTSTSPLATINITEGGSGAIGVGTISSTALSTINITGGGSVATTIGAISNSGSGAITINHSTNSSGTTSLNLSGVTAATAITVNDTAVSAPLTITGAITDNSLSTLTLRNTGTGVMTFPALTSNALATVNVQGSGFGSDVIGTLTSGTSGTLTINDTTSAAAALGLTVATTTASGLTVNDSSTGALTLTALTDNALTAASFTNTGTALFTASGITSSALSTVGIAGTGAQTHTLISTSNTGNLTVTDSGSGAVTITQLTQSGNGAATQVTNSGSGLLTITAATLGGTTSTLGITSSGSGGITDTANTFSGSGTVTLTNSGSGVLTETALTANSATTLTFVNSGTGTIVNTNTSVNAATQITLVNGVSGTITDTLAGAVTVSGSTDNSNLTLNMTGAGAHTITVGSGANVIVGGSLVDNITVATGANNVQVTGAAGADSITLGAAHTGTDTVIFAAGSAAGVGVTTSTDSITNWLVARDVLSLSITAQAGSLISTGGNVAVAAAATPVVQHVTTATTATIATATNVIVLDYTIANATALVTAIGTTAATLLTEATSFAVDSDFVIVWTDGTNSYLGLINDANNPANAALLAANLTYTPIATLTGVSSVAGLTAANFSFIA